MSELAEALECTEGESLTHMYFDPAMRDEVHS